MIILFLAGKWSLTKEFDVLEESVSRYYFNYLQDGKLFSVSLIDITGNDWLLDDSESSESKSLHLIFLLLTKGTETDDVAWFSTITLLANWFVRPVFGISELSFELDADGCSGELSIFSSANKFAARLFLSSSCKQHNIQHSRLSNHMYTINGIKRNCFPNKTKEARKIFYNLRFTRNYKVQTVRANFLVLNFFQLEKWARAKIMRNQGWN